MLFRSFEAIEKDPRYGAAFKRIMGEIAAELAEKDKKIAELAHEADILDRQLDNKNPA